MFEGPGQYSGEDDNLYGMPPEQDMDLAAMIERKKKEREEQEAREKTEKAAQEAKEKSKKQTKKINKISKKIQETKEESKNVKDAAKKAGELAEDIKEQAKVMGEELNDEINLPAPVEMSFSDGSEYIAGLKEGEEAIFDLQQSAEKLEASADIAEHIAEKAVSVMDEREQAIARARAALEQVDAEEVGATVEGREGVGDVFGDETPAQDVVTRLRKAWGGDTARHAEVEHDTSQIDPNSYQHNYDAVSPPPIYHTEQSNTQTESPDTTTSDALRSGAAAFGGYFAGRANAMRRNVDRVNTELSEQATSLKDDIAAIQHASLATAASESMARQQISSTEKSFVEPPHLPKVEYASKVENTYHESVVSSNTESPSSEIKGNFQAVIPAWIKQFESEVKKGKVVELKKWQRDVLRVQHPNLLKKYDAFDGAIRHSFIEQKSDPKGSRTMYSPPISVAVQNPLPQDLPRPTTSAYTMPAYMQQPAEYSQSSHSSALDAHTTINPYSARSGSVFSTTYVTTVTFGGIVFGAILIALFGF